MTLHLSSRQDGGDDDADTDLDSSSGSGNSRGRLSRREQREVLAELMASKAVQSQIPYW